ncbi:MAG: hypothetical protein ACP5KN_04225 [Armatimonadota bacterium]
MRRQVITAVIALLVGAVPTCADVLWPQSHDWCALTCAAGLYFDPDDSSQDWLDLRGGTDDSGNPYAAAFWASDEDHLMFRLRLDATKPGEVKGVWEMMMDAEGDAILDWSLRVDSKTDDQVELLAITVGGPTLDDIEFAETPVWSGTMDRYHLLVDPTGDGSLFDGDSDVFHQFAIPWSDFAAVTGVSDPRGLWLAPSVSRNDTSGFLDYPLDGSGGSFVGGTLSQAPEPKTTALLALGLLAVCTRVAVARRVRRQENPPEHGLSG